MPNRITDNSCRSWLDRHPLKVLRYLRNFHKREDYSIVFDLLYNIYPAEGSKLIKNFNLTYEQKKHLLVEWCYHQPQITCGIFADQRMGKDALICRFFDDVIQYCKSSNLSVPRFVTLGNIRKPPFVDDKDMYFSFKNIPSGKGTEQVWIYCSEIETVLPAREGKSPENALFAQLEGTLAQNHQKLFGACKLASKVDINFIRGMNVKLFKYINPEKLMIDNVERSNILSDLGYWHLPNNPNDKKDTLLVFNNQLFLVKYDLPEWWNDDYSEQFRDVPVDKIKEYAEVMASNGLSVQSILTAISQKFRKNISKKELKSMIGDSETGED